ncbi:virulence factor SrfB [Polaribacter sp. Z014]|uniref:virulence factor SrfB n=1 Tax=unclassified Polaribacter TaxID=196858 RepID=UPI00202273BC|nr:MULTISPECIES: virulence factor SrfB [unclassified Polaribacter]MCL7765041.1 virulence factor SrfB [Polaribacter sp. Z014]MDX6746982.1 virulence factor SrfB [Polaribacter sp. PL03]
MIELIQNTGIQFIEIPLNIDEDDNLSSEKSFAEEIIYDEEGKEESGSILFPYKWNDQYIDFDSINAEAIDKNGNVIPDEIREDFIKIIAKKNIYKIRGREAFDIYTGHWIPIPYFRTRNDKSKPFHAGPQDWCRMWFGEVDLETKKKENCTHKIVLAFDTETSSNEQKKYLKPNESDATPSGNIRFKCVIKERFFTSFYSREDIDTWLTNIYDLKASNTKNYFRHYANYFVLLDILDKVGGFPEIALLTGERTIDTSLILDIGNSRTCGLLVETTSPKANSTFDLTSSKKVQIRDLSIPYKTYAEPFEMQVAFAEEKFGNEASAFFNDVFQWPSLLRVGKEAVRLTSIFESEDSQATMSSPKRYLWDYSESNLPWIKVDKDGYIGYSQTQNLKKAALFGIAEYLNIDGSLNESGFPTTESNYSRASLMTFALVEIIYQAISQINNHNFRKDMGNSSFRRILKDIVITCPTAMTLKEQTYLNKSLETAVLLVKKQYPNIIHEQLKIHPSENEESFEEEQKYWKYDEATCSQITYLYSELVDKFKGKHELFFRYKGKKRKNTLHPDKESVTIASVDIGGGTTDLMICNYQTDADSEIPIIKPIPVFWEGFNVAGDDIVKRIIEFVVLPSIEKSLKEDGGINVDETLNYLFGQNLGNQAATHRIYRKQFANQIATYCAYEAINHVMNNAINRKKKISDIFKSYPKPKNNLIPYIEEVIQKKCALPTFNFLDVLIDFDTSLINYAIADIIKPVIEQLTALMGVFDCDVLLLSGKSSNLGIIRELFEKTLVLSPDKIINFGNYKFGDWYPFANFGEVKDPKTTVSVGALIAFLSSINRLDKFRIDLSRLSEIQSTAEYLGVMSDDFSRIKDSKIIFEKNKFEGAFKFFGAPISIGMRQLPSEDWIATSLYVFGFKDDLHKELLTKEDFEYPFTITISRDEENKEELLIDDIAIVDKNGYEVDGESYFTLLFKTLPSGLEYWKDNGSFLLKNYTDE